MSQWGRYVEAFSYGAPKKTNEWSAKKTNERSGVFGKELAFRNEALSRKAHVGPESRFRL
jgi:hypothetical protein